MTDDKKILSVKTGQTGPLRSSVGEAEISRIPIEIHSEEIAALKSFIDVWEKDSRRLYDLIGRLVEVLKRAVDEDGLIYGQDEDEWGCVGCNHWAKTKEVIEHGPDDWVADALKLLETV